MPRRRLTWNRTDEPDQPRYDYTGLDLDRPAFHARVYLSPKPASDRRWSWLIAERTTIATAVEATLEEAVAAAEHAYAIWLAANRRR